MDTIKATEVQICIFTLKQMGSVSLYPADEQRIFQAFGDIITELRAKHGNDLPVYLEFCPLTDTTNQGIVSFWGFSALPAVQVIAKYPNGQIAQYGLSKDFGDKFTGVNWTADDLRPYVEAVLYQREPANASWLCKIFPPLCNLGGWVWLASALYSTWKFAEAKDQAGKIVYGTAAGLTWQSFLRWRVQKIGL